MSLLRKAEINENSGFTGDLLFPNPLAIVHVTGYEGFFCEDKYLVLSYYKDNMYFARKRTSIDYRIVLISINYGKITEYEYDFDTMPMARLDNKSDWSYIFTRKAEPICIETKLIDKLKAVPELIDGHLVYEGTDTRLVNSLLGYLDNAVIKYVDGNPCNILPLNITVTENKGGIPNKDSVINYCADKGKYHVFIQHNGAVILNQYFDTEAEAEKAKNIAERSWLK